MTCGPNMTFCIITISDPMIFDPSYWCNLLHSTPLCPDRVWIVAIVVIPDPQPQQSPTGTDIKTSYIDILKCFLVGQVLLIRPPDLQDFCSNETITLLTFCTVDFTASLISINGESNCLLVGDHLIPNPVVLLHIVDGSNCIEDLIAYIQAE